MRSRRRPAGWICWTSAPEGLRERIARSYPPAVAARALEPAISGLENLAALSRSRVRRWIREHGFGPAGEPARRRRRARDRSQLISSLIATLSR